MHNFAVPMLPIKAATSQTTSPALQRDGAGLERANNERHFEKLWRRPGRLPALCPVVGGVRGQGGEKQVSGSQGIGNV